MTLLPADTHILDVAAVLGGADAFVGTSLHGTLTAATYAQPIAVLDMVGYDKLRAVLAEIGLGSQAVRSIAAVEPALDGARSSLQPAARALLTKRVGAHFDQIAGAVTASRARRGRATAGQAPARLRAAMGERIDREQAARAGLARQYVTERLAAKHEISTLRAELTARDALIEGQEQHAAALHAELAGLNGQIGALRAQIGGLQAHIGSLKAQAEAQGGEIVRLHANAVHLTHELRAAGERLEALGHERNAAVNALEALLNSRILHYTRPLRDVAHRIRATRREGEAAATPELEL